MPDHLTKLTTFHTLLTKIKTCHSFTTKPSVTLATSGIGEENQPPRLMAASAFASVFEPGHTCLLYICMYREGEREREIHIYIHETLQGWFWRSHGLPKSVFSFHTSSKNQLFYEFASKTPCEPLLARFQVFLSTIISPMMEPQGGVREPWFSLKPL